MQNIIIDQKYLMDGVVKKEQNSDTSLFHFPKDGSGLWIPQAVGCKEQYLSFQVKVLEEHSVPMHLLIYTGEEKPALEVRFGLLPQVRTQVCLDFDWFAAKELFPEHTPGMLKIVCHGRRVSKDDITKIALSPLPSFHDIKLEIGSMVLSEQYPDLISLSEEKLVDCFGQAKWKEWENKTTSLDDLKGKLQEQAEKKEEGYPFADWSIYGGWKEKKLKEETGYFSKQKESGKWWLVDPLGYAYFSVGPDCVGAGNDCRVDGVEQWLDWLPEKEDAVYGKMFSERKNAKTRRSPVMFSYTKANLYKAFGKDWYETWKSMICGQLKKYGMNTLGNWSDPTLFGTRNIPYVTSLPEFPSTKETIFRDFPDVFSEEYKEQAERCAQALKKTKDDPWMIGYFLRNEPAWAFVDNLMLADEVLYNPVKTVCKERLVEFLKERYKEIEKLNLSWNCSLKDFESLYEPKKDVSKYSEAAKEDMREFSRQMLRAYIGIPSEACRRVDKNHMILGMRWAWISNPDLVAGWENFDVFSINCYAVDPTKNLQRVADLGVDLPVMIGEFHFGALDAGLPATGLEGVKSQKDRGTAYQYYVESVAAHPNGVGCHYFQCYDQFVLGRFDGENYNIGLFDICSTPYPDMLKKVKECSSRMYAVADKRIEKTQEKAEKIPMIAY